MSMFANPYRQSKVFRDQPLLIFSGICVEDSNLKVRDSADDDNDDAEAEAEAEASGEEEDEGEDGWEEEE